MHTTPTEDLNSGRNIISYTDIVTRNLKLDVLETKNKKKIDIVKNQRGDFLIQFATGGEKPAEFSGKFTTLKAIEFAIQSYLNRKADAKTESSKTTN